jgi:hypothetical protein
METARNSQSCPWRQRYCFEVPSIAVRLIHLQSIQEELYLRCTFKVMSAAFSSAKYKHLVPSSGVHVGGKAIGVDMPPAKGASVGRKAPPNVLKRRSLVGSAIHVSLGSLPGHGISRKWKIPHSFLRHWKIEGVENFAVLLCRR